jgi:hypothetical protein
MSARIMTVLYEDQTSVTPKNYGPHMLLLACVADALGRDRWELREHVVAAPKKGDSKLRAALAQDGELLAKSGPIVAVFDHDHVRDCFKLTADACKRTVLVAIKGCTSAGPEVVLLVENMETVITACCQVLGRPVPEKKPTPLERDGIVQAVANSEDRAVREALLSRVPSFKRLGGVVERWLRLRLGTP